MSEHNKDTAPVGEPAALTFDDWYARAKGEMRGWTTFFKCEAAWNAASITLLATQPAEPAPAPTAQADDAPLVRFVKHLSENCIGQVVTEDALEEWALDVLDSTPREVIVRPGPRMLVASVQTPARQQSATPAEPAHADHTHEWRVEPPYGMRCRTCGVFQEDDRQGVALSEAAVIGVVELEVVIDEDGFPVWCAAVPNACQEHIKDAVEREIFGAEKWVVRSYIRHPGYLAQDVWQDGYRSGIEKGRKDQAVHEKHYRAGFDAARASSSQGVALSDDDDDDEGPSPLVEWDKFPGWLIDHHEGDTISEELLQHALADMLKVHPARASSSLAEVEIPEGYVLVPKEPTEAINTAIAQAIEEGWLDAMIWYKALLAAAEAPNGEKS